MHHYYREPGTTATIFVIKINDNYTIYSKQYKMFKSKYYIINKITGKTICTTDNSEQFKEQLIEKNIEVDLKKLTEFDWYLPPHQE